MNEIRYPITNSVVFSMVMEDPAMCKGLIERIFPNRKVGAVKIKERPKSVTEATLIAGIRAKPVRLDVRYDPKLGLPLGDESYIIILNSKCSKEKVPENLRSLFRYINESEVTPGDGFIEVMHDRVEALQEWEEVKNIMTLEEEFRVRWRQGMKTAREEGLKEGLKEAEKAAKDTETRLNALNSRLLDDDRLEDLKRSLMDAAFQRQLFEEYGL